MNNESERERAYREGRIDTTDGQAPQSFETPAPGPIDASGQHTQYWVLGDAERARGFIRPVRHSYKHVGIAGPAHPLRDLTEDETALYADVGFVKFEAYPPGSHGSGRFWTREELGKIGRGCGAVTTMGGALAETYARDPRFYGATMCVRCGTHLPVGRDGEFVWDNTDERVGT